MAFRIGFDTKGLKRALEAYARQLEATERQFNAAFIRHLTIAIRRALIPALSKSTPSRSGRIKRGYSAIAIRRGNRAGIQIRNRAFYANAAQFQQLSPDFNVRQNYQRLLRQQWDQLVRYALIEARREVFGS